MLGEGERVHNRQRYLAVSSLPTIWRHNSCPVPPRDLQIPHAPSRPSSRNTPPRAKLAPTICPLLWPLLCPPLAPARELSTAWHTHTLPRPFAAVFCALPTLAWGTATPAPIHHFPSLNWTRFTGTPRTCGSAHLTHVYEAAMIVRVAPRARFPHHAVLVAQAMELGIPFPLRQVARQFVTFFPEFGGWFVTFWTIPTTSRRRRRRGRRRRRL